MPKITSPCPEPASWVQNSFLPDFPFLSDSGESESEKESSQRTNKLEGDKMIPSRDPPPGILTSREGSPVFALAKKVG